MLFVLPPLIKFAPLLGQRVGRDVAAGSRQKPVLHEVLFVGMCLPPGRRGRKTPFFSFVCADELTAPWSASSFRALHVQRISVALQLAAAEEIFDTIPDRPTAAMRERTPAEPLSGSNRDIARVRVP